MPARNCLRVEWLLCGAPSMGSSFNPRWSQTGKKVTGLKSTGSFAKPRAQRQATLSRWRSIQRNWNPRCRWTCAKLSRLHRRRARYGRTSRRSRAQIGSIGLSRRSSQRLARGESSMPARCSLVASDAFAALIGQGSTVKASAPRKRRLSRAESSVLARRNVRVAVRAAE